MIVYFDASAWCAALNDTEKHFNGIRSYIKHCQSSGFTMISNQIIHLEVKNAISRQRMPASVADSLDLLATVSNDKFLLAAAGFRIFPPDEFGNPRHLKALDKLHLETAIQARADVIVVYDKQLQNAARAIGIAVEAP